VRTFPTYEEALIYYHSICGQVFVKVMVEQRDGKWYRIWASKPPLSILLGEPFFGVTRCDKLLEEMTINAMAGFAKTYDAKLGIRVRLTPKTDLIEIYYDQNKDHGMNSWSNWASKNIR